MVPDLTTQYREFVVVLESLPADSIDQVPYWTKVDRVAQISQTDYSQYRQNCLDHLGKKRLSAKGTLVNGRRIFDTSRLHVGSARTVSFSPRVDIQPIERCRYADDNEHPRREGTVGPLASSPLSQVTDNTENTYHSCHRESRCDWRENQELMFQEFFDLVPPDFEIIDADMSKIYVASATNDCDSDSVSYISSESDND